jgi:TolB-like protein/tetratricopeptide (TPR) repeat protein
LPVLSDQGEQTNELSQRMFLIDQNPRPARGSCRLNRKRPDEMVWIWFAQTRYWSLRPSNRVLPGMLLTFDDVSIDTDRRELRRNDRLCSVEPQVFDLLEFLIKNRNRPVSRSELLEAIWNGRIVSPATLTHQINAARAAIGDDAYQQRLIRTVVQQGVRFVGAVKEQRTTARPTLTKPHAPSIAVLPFINVSEVPDYFADGIVEEIITGLSRVKWLFVIARNSTFAYKGRAVDPVQVGNELGVRYILEGNVRRSRSRVCVVTQIIETETGTCVQVERYELLIKDIFMLQDDLTRSVAVTLERSFSNEELIHIRRQRPKNLDAYDLVLRARPFASGTTEQDASTAIRLLERALEVEPDYTGAHALLAWCCHIRLELGESTENDRVVAVRHAHEVLTAVSDDATALAIAGLVFYFYERNTATALNLLARALCVSHSNALALCCNALVYAGMGKAEFAIDLASGALRLSPFDSINCFTYNALAISYFQTKRYEEMLEASWRSQRCNRHFSTPHALMAAALVRLGRTSEANVEARRVLELEPAFSIQSGSARIGLAPELRIAFADAWTEAGLPDDQSSRRK